MGTAERYLTMTDESPLSKFIHKLLFTDKDYEAWRLLEWLMFSVVVREEVVYHRGQAIIINPGELLTSLRKLSRETGLSVKVTRNRIEKLGNAGWIKIKSTPLYTKIYVNNWDEYLGEYPE